MDIKYFDNVQLEFNRNADKLLINGGTKFKHEIEDEYTKNFYELYVDNTMLMKHVFGEDKYETFLISNTGFLSEKLYHFSELLVNALLTIPIDREIISAVLRKYKKPVLNESRIVKALLREFSWNDVRLYGCKYCGDRACGGFSIEVNKDENFYYWKVPGALNFRFKKNEYEAEVLKYLKTPLENT